MKICNKCAVPKEDDKFEKNRRTCIKCRDAAGRGYEARKDYFLSYEKQRRNDPVIKAERKEKRKIYLARPEVKERESKANKAYREEHRARLNAIRNENKRNNQQIKIKDRLRLQIWTALKGKKKIARTEELLGCTIPFFMKHIADQFKDGMTWENYGYDFWHIDHRVPCHAFDLSLPEHQKKCFHHSNLQPMLALDNMKKNRFIDPEKVKEYLAAKKNSQKT